MGSALGLQARDAGLNSVLVHFHSSRTCLDNLTKVHFPFIVFALKISNSFKTFWENQAMYLGKTGKAIEWQKRALDQNQIVFLKINGFRDKKYPTTNWSSWQLSTG